jgi:hypothetical protein
MNFSNWPVMVAMNLMMKNDGEINDNVLHGCSMKELTATIVAVDKISSKASLVMAQCDFTGEGVDNIGDQDSDGKLGIMLFFNTTFIDREDNDLFLFKECLWTLDLTIELWAERMKGTQSKAFVCDMK